LIKQLPLYDGGLGAEDCGMQKLSVLFFPLDLFPLTDDFSIDEELMPEWLGLLIAKLFSTFALESNWE
jgi:hypothetical protein